MPDEQLALPSELNHGGGTVPGLFRRQSLPHLFASLFVKRHRDAALASDKTDKPFSIDERMARKAPLRGVAVVFLGQLSGPNLRSVGGLKAEEPTFGPQCVDSIPVHGR